MSFGVCFFRLSKRCAPLRTGRWSFHFILLLISILPTTAAELHLNNGDRITGEVVMRVDDKIHFRSPILGDLVVAETDAAVIEEPDTPVESLAGLPPPEPKPKSTPATADTGSRVAAVPLAPPPPAPKPPRWKGKIEFGFSNQSGRTDALNLSVRTEAELKKDLNHYRANARFLYGKTSDIVSSNRRDGSFRWRHEISERIFTQSLSSYTDDRVAGIDLNLEQNGSVGYQFLRTDRHTGSLGAGLTVQYRDAVGVETAFNYLGEFFQDYTYKINGRLSFSQAINALYSPDSQARSISTGTSVSNLTQEAENYKVRFNSALQGKMSERISLNLRYEYEYDNAINNPAARTDQRITSSVGYAF